MIRSILLVVLVLFVLKPTFSQNSKGYQLNAKREWLMCGTGLLLASASYLASQNQVGLSQDEINKLDAKNIWGFDRTTVDNISASAANRSDMFLYASLATASSVLAFKNTRSDLLKIAVVGAETVFYTVGLTYAAKTLFLRPRPFMYNANNNLYDKADSDGRFSFFSGHSSISAAATFFTASTLNIYLPNLKYKAILWTAAAVLPAATALYRVQAGKHFPTDVITGYLVGSALGIGIPYLHSKPTNKISVESGLNGLNIRYRF